MISILCPTRNRPEQLRRAIASSYATSDKPDELEWVLYVDEDAEKTSIPEPDVYSDGKVKYVVGPRIMLTDTWNKCLPYATGDIMGQGNDDIIFRTQGWDSQINYMFSFVPDKILLVHGSDGGYHYSSFGAHSFVHRRWIETLGYFIPPYFSSDCGDTWINEIANKLDRRRALPFLIEHMHFIMGKAKIDQTTCDRLENHYKDDVGTKYGLYQDERDRDTEKLRVLLGIPYIEKAVSA